MVSEGNVAFASQWNAGCVIVFSYSLTEARIEAMSLGGIFAEIADTSVSN